MLYFIAATAILSSLLVSGCGFSHDEHITGPYRLIAVDIDSQMSICYQNQDGGAVGRINETVFSYGFNDRFIVAKQHPNNDRTVTNYFFLDMTNDSEYADPSGSVTGPLNKKQFEDASEQLRLPKFSRTLKSLE